jgi:hypothetical protein
MVVAVHDEPRQAVALDGLTRGGVSRQYLLGQALPSSAASLCSSPQALMGSRD